MKCGYADNLESIIATLCFVLASLVVPAAQVAQAGSPPASTAVDQSSTPAAVPAVKPLRMGVAVPSILTVQGIQDPSVAEAIRSTLLKALTSPSMEVVLLASQVPQLIEIEAEGKHCDYVVYNALSEKKPSGRLSVLRNATRVMALVPGVGAFGAAAVAVATAAAATQEAASLTGGITAKTQVTLQYQLRAMQNPTPILSNALNGKAQADGEDVISPLVAQEVKAIVDSLKTQH